MLSKYTKSLKLFKRCFSVDFNDKVFVWGNNYNDQMGVDVDDVLTPIEFPFNKKIVSMSCGEKHSACVTGIFKQIFIIEDGELYTWGKGEFGILGQGDENDYYAPKKVDALNGLNIKQVVCGQNHTLALSKDGYVFSWGYGGGFLRGAGALGHGDIKSLSSPAVIEFFEKNVFIKYLNQNIVIKEIAAGSEHSIALSSDGNVFSWGNGRYISFFFKCILEY